jgi:hypothetical protein
MIVPPQSYLVELENERHKKELAAIERFCSFMYLFESTGQINGVEYRLQGISVYDRVASFKSVSPAHKDYFFDAHKNTALVSEAAPE